MTCDDYQIAFDQQRAGVTPAIAADELAGHIAGCSACTAYVSLSEQVATAMTTTLLSAPTPPTAEAILAEATKHRRRLVMWAVIIPVYLALIMGVVFVHHGVFEWRYLAPGLLPLLVGLAIGGAVFYARMRNLDAITRGTSAAAAGGWNKDLRWRARVTLIGAVVSGCWALAIQMFKFGTTLPHGSAGISEASMALFCLLFLYSHRQVRRELTKYRD